MEKLQVLNKKYQLFFEEIWKDVKKLFDTKKYSIYLFLGGKNRGKSTTAFNIFFKYIKKGLKVVYMRNSLQEIKNIKDWIAFEVSKLLKIEVLANEQGIFNKSTKEIIVLFASSKNYNNLSGNVIPYSLVFYDEYNQNLNNDMIGMMERFLLSMNTLFRKNQFKILVCGNTATKNNIFYNLYKIDPPLSENAISIYSWNDYLLCIRYDDTAFARPVGFSKDIEMIKKANAQLYEQFFEGKSYGYEDELIINKVKKENWKPRNLYILIADRVYRLYSKLIDHEEFWGIFFESYFTNEINKLPNFRESKKLTSTLKFHNLFNYEWLDESDFIKEASRKIVNYTLFFDDYISYNYFVENKRQFSKNSWKGFEK